MLSSPLKARLAGTISAGSGHGYGLEGSLTGVAVKPDH
jgi:hypothetical protein